MRMRTKLIASFTASALMIGAVSLFAKSQAEELATASVAGPAFPKECVTLSYYEAKYPSGDRSRHFVVDCPLDAVPNFPLSSVPTLDGVLRQKR